MLNNLKSIHEDYASFEFDGTNFKESKYLKHINDQIDEKSVFIFPSNSKKLIGLLTTLLPKKGFKIYILDNKKSGTNGSITYVRANTDEYYNAISVCKYIFLFKYKRINFIKKEGQIVINAIVKYNDNTSTFFKRIRKPYLDSISDYYLPYTNCEKTTLFMRILKEISKNSLNPVVSDNDKQELLLVVGNNTRYVCKLILNDISKWIDYKKYNISLVVSKSYSKTNSEFIKELDPRIKVFVKNHPIHRDLESEKRLRFLLQELYYFEDLSNIDDFLPSYIFDCEAVHVFGNKKFDISINLGNASYYWYYLAKSCAKKSLFVDFYDYQASVADIRAGRAEFSHLFDKVYFFSKDNMNEAIKLCNELNAESKILKHIPINTKMETIDTKCEYVNIDGENRMIIDMFNYNGFDTLRINTINEKESAIKSYFVIDGTKSIDDNLKAIKAIANKQNGLFVYDIYNVLQNRGIEKIAKANNFIYFNSPKKYKKMLNHLTDCFVFSDGDEGINYIANKLGKNIHFVDSNGNETNGTISDSFDIANLI